MANQLTKRQKELLVFLNGFHNKHGIMPSSREIQEHFNFASQTAAMGHLRALERKGYIKRMPGKARAVMLVNVSSEEQQEHAGFAHLRQSATVAAASSNLPAKPATQPSANTGKSYVAASASARVDLHLREDAPERLRIPLVGNIAAGPAGEALLEYDRFVEVDASLAPRSRGARLFALKVRGDSMTGASICNNDVVILEQKAARTGDIVAALIDGEVTLKRLVKKNGCLALQAENPAYNDLYALNQLEIQGVAIALMRTL